MKISGLDISKGIIKRLKTLPKPSREMAVILVGYNPISVNFVNEKKKMADEIGVSLKIYNLADNLDARELREEVNRISSRNQIGGVIVQLPLPAGIDRHEILRDIPVGKDVDILGSEAMASFYVNESGVLPPSCGTVEELVAGLKIDLAKSKVAIVGLGLLVGKPLAVYMMHRAKEVILLDKLSDIMNGVKDVDIVISGAGKAKLILPEYLKQGAVLIDFGYDYSGGKLVGDFDHSDESKLGHLKFYTPTPGGTGMVLVAKLFENFYRLQKYD